MDRVTKAATDAMELLGLACVVLAVAIAAGHRFGLPGAFLAAGLSLLLCSGALTASRAPKPAEAEAFGDGGATP